MKKSEECQNYTLDAIRGAYKSLLEIEAEIHALVISSAKGLIDGKTFDVADFAGSFRTYERRALNFEKAQHSYEFHQENHRCELPEDISGIY